MRNQIIVKIDGTAFQLKVDEAELAFVKCIGTNPYPGIPVWVDKKRVWEVASHASKFFFGDLEIVIVPCSEVVVFHCFSSNEQWLEGECKRKCLKQLWWDHAGMALSCSV